MNMKILISSILTILILTTGLSTGPVSVQNANQVSAVQAGNTHSISINPDQIVNEIKNSNVTSLNTQISINASSKQVSINNSKISAGASNSASISVSVNNVFINDLSVVNSASGNSILEVNLNVTSNEMNKEIKVVRNQTSNQLQIQERVNNSMYNISTPNPVMFQNSKMYMNLSNNITKEVKYLPSDAVQALNSSQAMVQSMEMVSDNQTIKYKIKHQKRVRILGILPINMSVSASVDVTSGSISEELKPWWSVFVIE